MSGNTSEKARSTEGAMVVSRKEEIRSVKGGEAVSPEGRELDPFLIA